MGLGQYDDDGGSWGIAMTTHGTLRMTRVQDDGDGGYLDGLNMAPLGDKRTIRNIIAERLAVIRRTMPGGELPRVYQIDVADSPNVPLLVPAALGPETVLTLQKAAALGTNRLESVIRTLEDCSYQQDSETYEAMWRDNFPRTHNGREPTEEEVRAELVRYHGPSGEGRSSPTPAGMRDTLRNLSGEGGEDLSDEDLDRAVDALRRGEESDEKHSALTSTQNYAALATVLTSCAEVTVAAATEAWEGEGSEALRTARTVLVAIAGVSGAISGITSIISSTGVGAIVSAVFKVLELVCRFIDWILELVAGYTIAPQDGWNKEWNSRDCRLILKERLRILAQIEEKIIDNTPDGWSAHWEAAMSQRGFNEDERFNALTQFITATARNTENREANAKGIAQILGGREATRSLNMCEDISNWLGYVGLRPDEVKAINTWLYESRKVTVVLERREFLRKLMGNDRTGGPGFNVEYTGNMHDYLLPGTGSSKNSCRQSHPCGSTYCKVNFAYGSAGWYRDCCGLDVNDSRRFRPFPMADLEWVHEELRVELKVIPWGAVPAAGAGTRAGTYVPLDTPATAEIARRLIEACLSVKLPSNMRPGDMRFALVSGVPCVWFNNSGLRLAYKENSSRIRNDAKVYYTTTLDQRFGAFCGLPCMKPTEKGIYVSTPQRPFPPYTKRALLSSRTFREALEEAILNRGRRRTTFSAGASGGGGGALVLGLGAAAAVTAAVLLKK